MKFIQVELNSSTYELDFILKYVWPLYICTIFLYD